MRWRLGLGTVLLALFSGCLGGGDTAGAGGASSAPATPSDGAGSGPGLPAWAVGNWWTYETPFGESTYVVTADQGADWFLDTTNPDTAFLDARTDVSRLGPVRKSDLAGSQGSDRVEFFRFPLTHRQSWATRWDGFDVTVTALRSGEGFEFYANTTDGVLYSYSYEPRTGWFGYLSHHDANGTVDFGLKLTRSGHAFTGDVVRWNLTQLASDEGTGGAADAVPFEVPEGTTDIWAEYHFTCTGAAGYTFAVQPANPGLAAGQGAVDTGPCAQVDWSDVVQPEPEPGNWVLALEMGGETAEYQYALLLRTLETIPVASS